MGRCLKISFQADDEWMIDDGENFLLTLDMVDLLQLDDGTLFEALQSERLCIVRLASMLDESHSSKRARAQRR